MRPRVGVGRNEVAPGVLRDAQSGILDLVVVDVPVKPDDDGADVVVVRQCVPRFQFHFLVLVGRAAAVADPFQVQLLADAVLADHVDLLVLGEVDRFEVGRRGVRRRINLLGLDAQAKARELAQVSRARLGRVVGDEDEPLAERAEEVEGLRDAVDDRVAAPDDA